MPVAVDARTRAVQDMGLGDHAFAHYADDDDRWEVLSAFTRSGLTNGDKVIALADPAVEHEEVLERLSMWSPAVEKAYSKGQLEITSMRALIHPDRRFTAQRQIGRLWEESVRARQEGYAGLRSVIDMAWVEDLGMDVEGVMFRETHADALFTDRSYAEICTYDRRRFDPGVLEAMRVGHPMVLLERLGDLATYHSVNGLHVIGDADTATASRLDAALEDALTRAATSGRLLLNLTRMCFLSVTCARALVHRVASAQDVRWVDVRCSPFQARLLDAVGGGALKNLVLPRSVGGSQ
ncbi:hypothetical protein GCM10010145_24650 [Streptomyces ruber]|uniref:MEDS domain-containing protein n=2 Tax=Streptomyces TaxID=1883 RepID=A0A918EPZ7_9ACTN|nr:MEDS domain-containing protein [Streptomyces ruber]GGQ54220.1 hypothetical protein GCM10010145_24650 [Streptomyces ruber]